MEQCCAVADALKCGWIESLRLGGYAPFSPTSKNRCYATIELGYLTKDVLETVYYFPLNYFLRYAYNDVLLTIAFLFILVFCVILLFQDMRQEKRKGVYREQFVSAVIHNLKTPASTIAKLEYLLSSDPDNKLSPKEKDSLDKIRQLTSGLLESIGKLLTLSTDAHGLVIHPREFEVEPMLQNLSDTMQWEEGQGKRVRITTALQTSKTMINGDYHFLHAAFQNIIENALKYSGREVSVEINSQLLGRDQIRVEIADNGHGIPKESLKKIFKRHYRVHPKDKTVTGYGLGLHFVQNVVKAHKGKISVESTEGVGSKFIVVLPLISNLKSLLSH